MGDLGDDNWERELEKRLDVKNYAASAVPIQDDRLPKHAQPKLSAEQ